MLTNSKIQEILPCLGLLPPCLPLEDGYTRKLCCYQFLLNALLTKFHFSFQTVQRL